MKKDLGTDLEWAAAEHHNTEHPHVHVVIRGVRDSGETLRLSRDYVQQGIRSIAADLCTRQLGYRTELDGAEAERREIAEKRFTSIDKRLLGDAPEFTSDHFTIVRNSTHRLDLAKLGGLARATTLRAWPCFAKWASQNRLVRTVGACVAISTRFSGQCREPRIDSERLPRTGP